MSPCPFQHDFVCFIVNIKRRSALTLASGHTHLKLILQRFFCAFSTLLYERTDEWWLTGYLNFGRKVKMSKGKNVERKTSKDKNVDR
jgi:hypothetical protein